MNKREADQFFIMDSQSDFLEARTHKHLCVTGDNSVDQQQIHQSGGGGVSVFITAESWDVSSLHSEDGSEEMQRVQVKK